MRIYNNKLLKPFFFRYRASFLISRQNLRTKYDGSITVEASIALPVFIYGCMAIASLIIYYGTYVKVEKALYNTSLKLAKYGYAYEALKTNTGVDLSSIKEENFLYQLLGQGMEIGTVSLMVIDELDREFIDNSCIDGGIYGMNFLNSKLLDDDGIIEIVLSYKLKNPFDIFAIGKISITQKVKVRMYKGDKSLFKAKSDTTMQYVYITQTGSVYHIDENCTYIKINPVQILYSDVSDQRNNSGAKYYSCEKCGKKVDISGNVFITKYGTRYHSDINCSELKRGVLKISIDEVGDRKSCSKCGEK